MTDDPDDLLDRWARSTDPGVDPITGDEVRAQSADVAPGYLPLPAGSSHRRRWVLAAAACVLVAVAVGGAVLARGDDDGRIVTTGPALDAGDGEGAVTVQLPPDSCCFIEGFEIGLRFERADGEVIASTLWSDFVAESGGDDMDAYYDSVLTQPVPTGTVIVRAQVEIGPGGPPATPDLEGDLPCRLAVDVGPGETVPIEVLFHDDDGYPMADCLRRLDEAPPPTTSSIPADPVGPTTSTAVERPPGDDVAEGAVTVQLAPDSCCYIEGFEAGLRFETPDGEVIASTLWSDWVAAAGGTGDNPYYDSILVQPVTAGTIVVRAEVSIGGRQPPVPPDLDGDLPCRLEVTVPPEATVALELVLEEVGDACLRRLDG